MAPVVHRVITYKDAAARILIVSAAIPPLLKNKSIMHPGIVAMILFTRIDNSNFIFILFCTILKNIMNIKK